MSILFKKIMHKKQDKKRLKIRHSLKCDFLFCGTYFHIKQIRRKERDCSL